MSGSEGTDTVVLRRGRDLIIYDARLGDTRALDALLDAAGTPLGGGRGASAWIARPGGDAVRRGYRRGGGMRALGDRYLRLGARGRRPFREWRLLRELAEEGLPVPRPLAARVRPRGLWYRGEIWLAAAAGRPLPEAVADGLAASPEAAVVLGRLLGRLHGAGVDHPDLHVGNVLVRGRGEEEGDYTFLDFDRARRRPPGRWRRRRLARLRRSLGRLPLTEAARGRWWEALLEGYRDGVQGRR